MGWRGCLYRGAGGGGGGSIEGMEVRCRKINRADMGGGTCSALPRSASCSLLLKRSSEHCNELCFQINLKENTTKIFRVDKTGQVEGSSEYESEKIMCPFERLSVEIPNINFGCNSACCLVLQKVVMAWMDNLRSIGRLSPKKCFP